MTIGSKLILAAAGLLLWMPVYTDDLIYDEDGFLEGEISGEEVDDVEEPEYSSVYSEGSRIITDKDGNYSGRLGRDGSIYDSDGNYSGRIK